MDKKSMNMNSRILTLLVFIGISGTLSFAKPSSAETATFSSRILKAFVKSLALQQSHQHSRNKLLNELKKNKEIVECTLRTSSVLTHYPMTYGPAITSRGTMKYMPYRQNDPKIKQKPTIQRFN